MTCMSDATTIDATPEKIKVDENLSLELCGFDEKSKNHGFTWYIPQFSNNKPEENLKALRDFFTKNSKSGRDGAITIITLINSAISSRFRSMATAELLEDGKPLSDEKREAKLAENSVLFSKEDALTYAPERDSESVSGYTKQLNDLKKSTLKAKNEGNIDLARSLAAKWKETKQKLDELIAEQQASDEKLMSEFNG